jgi:hypothetical protein
MKRIGGSGKSPGLNQFTFSEGRLRPCGAFEKKDELYKGTFHFQQTI